MLLPTNALNCIHIERIPKNDPVRIDWLDTDEIGRIIYFWYRSCMYQLCGPIRISI